jgi:hypothetical protein
MLLMLSKTPEELLQKGYGSRRFTRVIRRAMRHVCKGTFGELLSQPAQQPPGTDLTPGVGWALAARHLLVNYVEQGHKQKCRTETGHLSKTENTKTRMALMP